MPQLVTFSPSPGHTGKTNMFHYRQKSWNQRGISVESRKFHIHTILWKFQVPHYLCRNKIPTVELECNLYGTESHST